jgi:fatty acid desaturase
VLSHLAVLIVGSALGYAETVWLLWYLPAWIGRFWLSLVFGWLPHHPHSETGRYRDTRIFTFIGSTFLIRGHDHHLLHHLFPVVPHYRLRALWVDMRDHLAEQGARIEGRAATNHPNIFITEDRHSGTTNSFHFSRQDGTRSMENCPASRKSARGHCVTRSANNKL